MNAAWFDAFARSLAGRRSRRMVLRGTGAGVTAGLLGGLRPGRSRAAIARQAPATPYVVVRQYPDTEPSANLEAALRQGYGPLLAQQPGFIEYVVYDDGAGISSITIFDTEDDEAAAADEVASWVSQNLATLLPAPNTVSSGSAFVNVANQDAYCPEPPSGPTPTTQAATATPTATAAVPTATALPICTDPSRPGVGCACSTGTENPCGDTTLVCCANDADAAPGAPGSCTPASVGCEPLGPSPTPEPSPTPCSGIGCPCTAGVEGTCDDGLVCCQSVMNGPSVPGGPGQCAAPDACGDTDDDSQATPVA